MLDLIERKEALQMLCAACSNMGSFACISCAIPGIVKNIPKIEAEPVRRGRWIYHEQKNGYLWKCSACKGNFDQQYRYCPFCGAQMKK